MFLKLYKWYQITQRTTYDERTKLLDKVVVLNPFNATGLFLYPLKTSENQRVSEAFCGIERHQWHEKG